MWRSKKFLIIGVLVVIVLAATLGGVAVAQANDENTNTSQAEDNTTTLMDKVATIYQTNTGTAIDPQELEKAFEQAGQEIRSEAMDNFLQKLVTDGKITQEQADQWKAWLDARPDIPSLSGKGGFGGMMPFGGMRNGKGGFDFKFGNGASN